MTALAANRDTKEIQYVGSGYTPINFGVAASTTIYAGALVAINSSGYAVPASADTSLRVFGVAMAKADNSAGAAAAVTVDVRKGVFEMTNGSGADAITIADFHKLCYASDDNVVNKTDGAGLRPVAGKIMGLRDSQVLVYTSEPSLTDSVSDAVTGSSALKGIRVRNVVNGNIADLTAYTVASSASRNDAVLNVAGDIVMLIAQTTVAQNGLYKVGTVATGTAPLTRVYPMPLGYAFLAGEFAPTVAEGTIFANTKWFNASAGTIGTDTPGLYPESVTISQALTSGTATAISSIPLLSATKSNIVYTRTAVSGTLTTTVSYQTVPAPTAGPVGTASIVPMATVAAGTIQTGDASTLLVTVINR